MKSLQEFYNDKDTMNNVKKYLIEYLGEEAKVKIFAREDVSGIADAREAIDKAFDNLDNLFAPKVARKNVNEAR